MPLGASVSNSLVARWFTGPSFLLNTTLYDFSENIVSTDHIPETLTEVNAISNNLMISDINKSIFNWEYYSDLYKIIKHFAWILKLKSNWLNWKRNKKQCKLKVSNCIRH